MEPDEEDEDYHFDLSDEDFYEIYHDKYYYDDNTREDYVIEDNEE